MAGVHLVFLSRTLKGIGEDSQKKKSKRCLKDVTDEPGADDLARQLSGPKPNYMNRTDRRGQLSGPKPNYMNRGKRTLRVDTFQVSSQITRTGRADTSVRKVLSGPSQITRTAAAPKTHPPR